MELCHHSLRYAVDIPTKCLHLVKSVVSTILFCPYVDVPNIRVLDLALHDGAMV